jgi:hypothetical protein
MIAGIGLAPQQAFIGAAIPIDMLPVGVEYFDDPARRGRDYR